MMLGAAMETIVWSMKVIDTAKSIAARASVWFGAPRAEPPAGPESRPSGARSVLMIRVCTR